MIYDALWIFMALNSKLEPSSTHLPTEFQFHAETLQQHGLIVAFVQVLRDVPE